MLDKHRWLAWFSCSWLLLIALPVAAGQTPAGSLALVGARILAPDGDPLHDVGALRRPRVVLCDGRVVVDRRAETAFAPKQGS